MNLKKRWISLLTLLIAGVVCFGIKSYASNHPTDTHLTFQTVSTNQMKSPLKYKNSDTFTIESWFKVSSFPPQFYSIAGSATGNNLSAGLIVRSTKKIVFRDFATETTDRDILTSTTTIVPNVWYHAAVTYDNGTAKLYVNGVLEETGTYTLTKTMGVYKDYLMIGSVDVNTTTLGKERAIDGSIADVRVWNIARTEADILATKDNILTGNEPGLIGYYKLSNDTTGKVYDASPLKNDATGQNFQTTYPVSSAAPTDTTISYSLPSITGMQNVVERNGVVVNSDAGTSYTDTSLIPDTSYTYTFYAKNGTGETQRTTKTIRTIKPPSSGLALDGVDDVVEIPSNAQNNVSTTAFTIEGWIRVDRYVEQAFLNKDFQYELQLDYTGSLQAAYYISDGWEWVDSGYKIPLHTWTHIASTFDGDRVRFYVNGVLVADKDYAKKGAISANYTGLRFGARDFDGNNVADNFMPMEFSSVRLWSTVRTEQQLQTSMNQKLTGSVSGLLAAYYLNDVTTGKVYDATTYGNHATVKGIEAGSKITPGNVTTASIPLTWNSMSGAVSYELKKDGTVVQNNALTSYTDSSTEDKATTYTLTPTGVDGESKSYTVTIRTPHTKGLLFNGTTTYAEYESKGYTYSGQPFSIESRISPQVSDPTNIGRTEEMIFGWRGWHQGLLYSSVYQQVCVQITYVRKSDGGKVRDRACTPLAAGTEALASLTFDPVTRTSKLYLNGELKLTYVSTYLASEYDFLSYPYFDDKMSTGIPAPTQYAYKGTIYETRLWNKTLSEDEIKRNVFTDYTGGTAGLVGYWRFYSFTTQAVYDMTGNARVGSIYNATNNALNTSWTARTNTTMSLTWDKIESSETFDVEKNGSPVVTNGTATTYAATGLTENTPYTWGVQAKNAYGKSKKELLSTQTFPTAPSVNNVPASLTLSPVSLTGRQQTLTSNMTGSVNVSNFTAGTGWNVSVSATRLTMKDGKKYMLPSGSLMFTAPTSIVGTDGTVSSMPTLSTGVFPLDDGNSYKLVSAASGSDVGAFSVTFPAAALSLTLLPGTTFVDNETYGSTPTPYETTLTWTITAGP